MIRNCDSSRFRTILFGVIWITSSTSFIACFKIPGDNSLLSNIVRFIRPYIQNLELSADTERPVVHLSVQQTIQQTIDKLKPYLQDNEYTKRNNEDDELTTIIEFEPKNLTGEKEPGRESLRTETNTYEKIKFALRNESVSNNVIKIVTRTLDELIVNAISNQCMWKNADPPAALRKSTQYKNISFEELDNIKQEFINIIEVNTTKNSKELDKFFLHVVNKIQNISQKYKYKCELVKDTDGRKQYRRDDPDGYCGRFKICSDELLKFLTGYYMRVKDTADVLLKNKVIVPGPKDYDSYILNNASSVVDRRIRKVFNQEIKYIYLDPNKINTVNINSLKAFIQITVVRIKKHVKKHLPNRLYNALSTALGKLEEYEIKKICERFATCNNKILGPRSSVGDLNKPLLKPYSVFVKLQVNLDDQLKDDIARYMFRSNRKSFNHRQDKLESLNDTSKDFGKYSLTRINVTRTTVAKSTTKTIANVKVIT